jgi:hypothetical protein
VSSNGRDDHDHALSILTTLLQDICIMTTKRRSLREYVGKFGPIEKKSIVPTVCNRILPYFVLRKVVLFFFS